MVCRSAFALSGGEWYEEKAADFCSFFFY